MYRFIEQAQFGYSSEFTVYIRHSILNSIDQALLNLTVFY
ncbi:unnamed protein product, partial [Rotaria socialis]